MPMPSVLLRVSAMSAFLELGGCGSPLLATPRARSNTPRLLRNCACGCLDCYRAQSWKNMVLQMERFLSGNVVQSKAPVTTLKRQLKMGGSRVFQG